MSILDNLLMKLGTSYEDLNEEERQTFNLWRESLAGRKITDGEVLAFMDAEYERAVEKITDPEVSEKVDMFYRMEVSFIKKLKDFIATPEKEKQMVEQHINSQIQHGQ